MGSPSGGLAGLAVDEAAGGAAEPTPAQLFALVRQLQDASSAQQRELEELRAARDAAVAAPAPRVDRTKLLVDTAASWSVFDDSQMASDWLRSVEEIGKLRGLDMDQFAKELLAQGKLGTKLEYDVRAGAAPGADGQSDISSVTMSLLRAKLLSGGHGRGGTPLKRCLLGRELNGYAMKHQADISQVQGAYQSWLSSLGDFGQQLPDFSASAAAEPTTPQLLDLMLVGAFMRMLPESLHDLVSRCPTTHKEWTSMAQLWRHLATESVASQINSALRLLYQQGKSKRHDPPASDLSAGPAPKLQKKEGSGPSGSSKTPPERKPPKPPGGRAKWPSMDPASTALTGAEMIALKDKGHGFHVTNLSQDRRTTKGCFLCGSAGHFVYQCGQAPSAFAAGTLQISRAPVPPRGN
jgi:hypothetical protein